MALVASPGLLEEVIKSPMAIAGESGSILTGTRPERATGRGLSAGSTELWPVAEKSL